MNVKQKKFLEEANKNEEFAELYLNMLDKVAGGISEEELERQDQEYKEFQELYEQYNNFTPEEIQELEEYFRKKKGK